MHNKKTTQLKMGKDSNGYFFQNKMYRWSINSQKDAQLIFMRKMQIKTTTRQLHAP
jgi:hypothetical protein